MALRYDERPVDPTPLHTPDLPATPQRDRRIPAAAWLEAPEPLLGLGADLGADLGDGPGDEGAFYLRRIAGWLLWRAGPPAGGHARYLALAADDLTVVHTFRLLPDGAGRGAGPSGTVHDRFRTWKEDLRDHPRPSVP
jgi:hypothetical protein